MSEKAGVVAQACSLLVRGDRAAAARYLRLQYPFSARWATPRKYTEAKALAVFLRDGFVDRYSGERLVFQGSLRILSLELPSEFPYHKNWKVAETHFGVWELSPSVDHIVPVSRGGVDEESNYATTSMLRNSAKAHWTLEELGWSLKPGGNLSDWDGLLQWFRDRVKQNPLFLNDNIVSTWYRASQMTAV